MPSFRHIATAAASALLAGGLAVGTTGCVLIQGTPPGAESAPNASEDSGEAITEIATFMQYEQVEKIDPLAPAPERGAGGFRKDPPKRKTGFAYVRLDDGTKIKAACGVDGLAEGDAVEVRHQEGEWTLVGPAKRE